MLLTGEPINAQTALAWGLVNRVVPAPRLDAEIAQVTDIILSRSSSAVQLGKQAFYGQVLRPLAAAYDSASEVMACNLLLDAAERRTVLAETASQLARKMMPLSVHNSSGQVMRPGRGVVMRPQARINLRDNHLLLLRP